MKMKQIILVAMLVVGLVYSTPLEKVKRQVGPEVELLPRSSGDADVQMDTVPMDNPRFVPQFYDFFNQFSDMANMLRAWFNRPFFRPSDFDDDDDDFGKLPPNYDNSTFTTKNINGSIITVNETIKKHESNDSSFVWHVKVVQIRPENATSDDVNEVGSMTSTLDTVDVEHTIPEEDDADNDVGSVPRVRRSDDIINSNRK